MYFFLPSFCPFCFSSFCLFPIFFCFVSDSGVFLPALLAVLFFLFQKIFSFSFPAFCRTSFRSSCLHHPSALTRPVRPALHGLCRLSYFLFVSSVFRKDLPVRNFVFQVFTTFVPRQHHHQPENRPVREPVSAPRRFSCRSFAPSLFSVAFALFSVLNFRHFFLLCCEIANYFFLRFPFSLFFSFPLLSLSEKIILSITPLHGLCRLSYVSLVSSVFRKDLPVRNSVSEVFTTFVPCQHHHQPENRPVRVSVSASRRFSCQSFVQTLFSIAFALFSVFSLQVLFLFDLTLFFFSRLVLFPLRPCPCSSCLFS